MTEPILKSCCKFNSLATGSIVSGMLGIVLAIASMIVLFTVRVEFRTIVFDWFPQYVVKIILAVNLCMTIFISILLIVGVVKRNHYLMMPWVVLGITIAIGLLISVIYTAVVFFIEGFILAGFLWLIFGLLACLIYAYMWMVVYSHFTVLKEERNRGRYNKQPYRR
ncbi:hypothetical protein HA402_015810 [Bradysia odoriphaga]|nr:hypothetical protein HA402_015810 [Bradysia odoriphaga]